MSVWQLLIKGLPTRGAYKKLYDRQRRNNDEHRQKANEQRRALYKKDPSKKIAANARYKERFIAEHGEAAWLEKQRAYARAYRERKGRDELSELRRAAAERLQRKRERGRLRQQRYRDRRAAA